jgi:hypothetical protein
MSERKIEDYITEILMDDAQKNALTFVAFLRESEMQFKRGQGYWADHFYLMVKYRVEYVCFVLIEDSEGTGFPWTIWSDTSDLSDSQWYEHVALDEGTREIAWRNVDFCGKCSPNSPCYEGTRKIIFGKEFDAVCRTTFRFDNPDASELECAKKLIELRKNDILGDTK